jgi:SAM-dependent methyltransferase
VGCGPGTITADLAALVRPGLVTAVELTEAALDLARAEEAKRSLGNIEFVVADVQDLHFADDTFDVVHAHQVLQHVRDPVRALREMGRVAKPGGVVAARDGDYGAFAWYPALPELDEWLSLSNHAVRENGGEPEAGRRLLSWAGRAGFTEIEASSSTWCFATEADRAWWGGLWSDRMLHSDLSDQLLRSGRADLARLTRVSEGWLRWAEAGDGWMSILHGEIICRGPDGGMNG